MKVDFRQASGLLWAELLKHMPMSMTAAIGTLNHFITTRYPGLLLIGAAIAFAGFTVSKIGDLDRRVWHIENVDLPAIRQDLKEIRVDIANVNIRLTKVEIRLDHIEEDIREMKADIKEMKNDIKILLARKN